MHAERRVARELGERRGLVVRAVVRELAAHVVDVAVAFAVALALALVVVVVERVVIIVDLAVVVERLDGATKVDDLPRVVAAAAAGRLARVRPRRRPRSELLARGGRGVRGGREQRRERADPERLLARVGRLPE